MSHWLELCGSRGTSAYWLQCSGAIIHSGMRHLRAMHFERVMNINL
jgi:hypothetical protein